MPIYSLTSKYSCESSKFNSSAFSFLYSSAAHSLILTQSLLFQIRSKYVLMARHHLFGYLLLIGQRNESPVRLPQLAIAVLLTCLHIFNIFVFTVWWSPSRTLIAFKLFSAMLETSLSIYYREFSHSVTTKRFLNSLNS